MSQVFLLSATGEKNVDPYNLAPVRRLRESAVRDSFKKHSLVEDPVEADVILFAELFGAGAYFEGVRRHELTRCFRERCYLYCSNDYVIPFLPGIYPSLELRWSSSRTRSGPYLATPENEFATFTVLTKEAEYLYAFIGSVETAPVRKRLHTLSHSRGFFQDTAAEYRRVLYGQMPCEEREEYSRRYADTAKASKFILCPRGLGTSSMRLFDTMRMGRVPVILADQWVEPHGPRWDEFSVRIPESEFACLPTLLEKLEPEAPAMAALARAEWERWFSPEVCFHRMVECCVDIGRNRRIPERLSRFWPYLQFVRPFHSRNWLRAKYYTWRERKAVR